MRNLLYGVRLCLSVLLALFIAYSLELDNASWAGTSACIVCLPSVGASLRKGQFRTLGTIIGAVFILVLTALFPQERVSFLLGLSLWCAICGFGASMLNNYSSYGAALAGFTAVLIFADAFDQPLETFHFAVTRATEICIGIYAAGFVLIMTNMGDARQKLAKLLSATAREILAGLERTLATGVEDADSQTTRRKAIRSIMALDPAIDEAIGEASDLHAKAQILRAGVEGLFFMASGWRAIDNLFYSLDPTQAQQVARAFLPLMARLLSADWEHRPNASRQLCIEERQALQQMSTADVSSRIVIDSLADALRGLERAANALTLLVNPGSEQPDKAKLAIYIPDPLPAVADGLRAFVAIGFITFFWIQSNWQGGQAAVTFTALGMLLFSRLQEDSYKASAKFILGTALIAAVAFVVDVAILPYQKGFLGLSIVLTTVMLPLAALSAGTWQTPVFYAMLCNFLPFLQPSNPPSYDIQNYLNNSLEFLAGAIVAAIFQRLILPVSATHRTERITRRAIRDFRSLLQGRWTPDRGLWISRLSRHLESVPKNQPLEDGARLMALLSVGDAIIQLRHELSGGKERRLFDCAIQSLARGDLSVSNDCFSKLADAPSEDSKADVLFNTRIRAYATMIAAVLNRHPALFKLLARNERFPFALIPGAAYR